MFNPFKKKEEKILELLSKDRNLFKEKSKQFIYSSDPKLLYRYLYEVLNFFYSCQILRIYRQKNDIYTTTSLEYESLMLISMQAELAMAEIKYEFFHYSKFIRFVIGKKSGLWLYHQDVFCMIIDELLKERYKSQSISDLSNEFTHRTQKIFPTNQLSSTIYSVCIDEMKQSFEFLENRVGTMNELGKSKIFNSDDFLEKTPLKNGHLDEMTYQLEISTNLFETVANLVDNFLIENLEINITEIDSNNKIGTFRRAIQDSLKINDGDWKKSEIFISGKKKEISGVVVKQLFNELVFDHKFINHINYNL